MSDGGSLTTGDLARLRDALSSMAPASDDAERIDRLRLLAEITSAVAAAQATEAVAFDRSQRADQARAGVPAARQGRGVAAQVALALRVSPWRAQRWLGFAHILLDELPATLAELRAGRTTEWRATVLARETVFLTREGHAELDAALAPHLEGWGDRRVEAEVRRAAYRLDPAGAVERARTAEQERRVSIRPLPDTMCRVSSVLPVAQGVAVYASLLRAADSTTAVGDERGRGQIMADTLVERVTGQSRADAVPVEVCVVLGADTLLGADDEPAHLSGYGPLPAGLGRRLAGIPDQTGDQTDNTDETDTADEASGRRWIRRLYTAPGRGNLVAMESTRREFTRAQRRFLTLRDQTCRTPWCDAPVRHADHVIAHSRGGPTALANGQGLCQACNHAKQADGWSANHTPTGHRYRSHPPDPPGARRRPTPLDQQLSRLLRSA